MVKPRKPGSVPVNILDGDNGEVVVTCTTIETCGASVGVFSAVPVEYAPVADITCKINRCK